MVDLHWHIGPGAMDPAQALRLASLFGYRGLALLLRDDGSHAEILPSLRQSVNDYSLYYNVNAICGVELVHIPPALLPQAVERARSQGAQIVAVHGEDVGANVEEGANLAAIEAGADFLAHPGLINAQAVAYAAEKQVALEISGHLHHRACNAHVAKYARQFGAKLVWGGNVKTEADILPLAQISLLCYGATLEQEDILAMNHASASLLRHKLGLA